MSYRAFTRVAAGDSVASDLMRGASFVMNPVAATAGFLTEQLLGSIFGESTHEKYLRWLGGYQAMEAAGRKRPRSVKNAIARAAYYSVPASTRLSMPSRKLLLGLLTRRNR